MKKIFKKLFSEDFMWKCTHVFLYLYCIISCLLPLFTDFCVFIGRKSVKHENYGIAQIFMSTARSINNFMLRSWDTKGCIEYELSQIKKKNKPEESMKLLRQAAELGCADAARQMAIFHFDQNEKLKGYYYLSKTQGPESDLDWATFCVIFGSDPEVSSGWRAIERLKENCKDVRIKNKAANALRYYKIFNNIRLGKKKWKDFIKENPNEKFFGHSLSDKKNILSIGILFLKTHLRFNGYNQFSLSWKKFNAAAFNHTSSTAFMINNTENFHPVTYANSRIETKPFLSHYVKSFDINILLNKDMPWREWGIEWLKMANEAGVKEANNILKLFTDAENSDNAAQTILKKMNLDDVAKVSPNTLK